VTFTDYPIDSKKTGQRGRFESPILHRFRI
jgi:hypothetical protein